MSETPAAAARMMGEAGSACDETLTDEQYERAARILDALAERCCRDYSPSEIARMKGVRGDAQQVHAVLPALVQDGHISSTERGAWSRYRFVWG